MNLVEAFLEHARKRPDAAALIDADGETISYAQLARLSAARAEAFRERGIGAGDVVLVARGLAPPLYVALLALFRIGAVAMFPEPAAGGKGVADAVRAARPKAMISGLRARLVKPFVPGLRDLPNLPEHASRNVAAPLAMLGDDAPALITFTSGSTGRPKGIVRSAGFLMLQHRLLEALRRTQPDDVDLISLPVFILSNLAAGAASVIPAGNLRQPAQLDGAALRAQISRHQVTRVIAPPAVCRQLCGGAEPMPQLSAIFTGGGPVYPNLLRALKAFAPNAAVHAVYGSTEAEPIAHIAYDEITDADWTAMAAGGGLLAGKPIPQISVAIESGEVLVAGEHVNRGYLDSTDNAATKVIKDHVLWHRTGDAARMDESGRLWLLGRREAVVDAFYPFAVETAALSWPGVAQAALVSGGGAPLLVIAGGSIDLEDVRQRAARLGAIDVVCVAAIPMDRRHNSKTDYARLKRMLS